MSRALIVASAETTRSARFSAGVWRRIGLLLLAVLLLLGADHLRAAVNPDDLVVFDFDNAAIDVVGGGFNDTAGAVTTVASSSVGGGVALPTGTGISYGTVSPAQQLYYWDGVMDAFVQVDLTSSSYPRTLVPVPSNQALVPGTLDAPDQAGNIMVWDYSTNTFVYFDGGAPNGSTKSSIAQGIYRFNPVAGTNTLVFSNGSNQVDAIAVKQDGTVYALLNAGTFNAGETMSLGEVVQITSTTAFTRVDGGASGTPAFSLPTDVSWDVVNQQILYTDEGISDASQALILHIDPANGARTYVANGSAGPAATSAGSLFNAPLDGYVQTSGRILYLDQTIPPNNQTPAKTILNTLATSGKPTATMFTSTQFGADAQQMSIIPPTLPVITTPTATNNNSSTSETLGGNVTLAGTALVTPTIQTRGVVYSVTSTNASPAIGGTGVAQVASTAATGVFTVVAMGLTANTGYSYAAYVSTYYGTVYTSIGTFTTPAAPTVTSPTAVPAANGMTATLGGDVTSDGGSTISARGVVYAVTSTNSNPIIGGSGVTNLGTTGTTGVFTVTATGLTQGAQYSYAAYATNSVGTTYTTVTTFTTPSPAVVASPPTVTALSGVGATLNGNVTSAGSGTITQRGFVYALASADPTPVLNDGTATTVTATGTTGAYSSAVIGLANGTTYAFRAFATTSVGTTYSSTVTFTTFAPPTANNQSVNVNLNTATPITLTATDPNTPAQTLTYTVTTQPAQGTLTGTAPNLTYTPTTGYSGFDSFQFTAMDSSGLTSNTATVSILVIGQPYITGFSPASGPAGTIVTITGNNFTGLSGVQFFHNVAATTFNVTDNTQLTVTVPAGAVTGVIRVTTGVGTNTSSTKFQVTGP